MDPILVVQRGGHEANVRLKRKR